MTLLGQYVKQPINFYLLKVLTISRKKSMLLFLTLARGMSLSSNYNLRPKACEILIENNLSKLILKRQSYLILFKKILLYV